MMKPNTATRYESNSPRSSMESSPRRALRQTCRKCCRPLHKLDSTRKSKRPEREVGDAGRGGRRIGLLRADIPPRHAEQANGQHVEQGEEPHAHGDVEVEQVGEADDLKVRTKVDPDGAAQKGHPEIEVDIQGMKLK